MKKISETKEKLLEVAFDLIWDSSYGSVSVDDICKRADINKGSFYHFFPTKADLVVEACNEHWRAKRPTFDRIFSSQNPPLDRIHQWAEFIIQVQKDKAAQYGKVCGCPYASVGSETAMFDEKLRQRSEELMNSDVKYLESALADAIREGSVSIKDPSSVARTLQSFMLGKMVEARVQNDLAVLDTFEADIMRFIGARTVAA